MTGDFHQILCSACKVTPERIADSEPESWRCPKCGISDTAENIIREAKEYAVEVTSRHVQDSARKAAQGSKFIKFKGNPIPKRKYRFITDLKF